MSFDTNILEQIEKSAEPVEAHISTDQCPHPVCGRRIEDRFLAFRLRNVLNTLALLLVVIFLGLSAWAYKAQRDEFTSVKSAIVSLQNAQLTVMGSQYESLKSVLDEYNRLSGAVITLKVGQADLEHRLNNLEKNKR